MKLRPVTIFGETFQVPVGIRRIDAYHTRGWQLRYAGRTKLYSDHTNDGSGARQSLERATKDLLRRIERTPAPSGLQQKPCVGKTSDLPVGISGPIYRQRPGKPTREVSLSISIPRYGLRPTRRTVYIGNDNTYTEERFKQALQKAVEIRSKAERAYKRVATQTKRAAGRVLRDAARAPTD